MRRYLWPALRVALFLAVLALLTAPVCARAQEPAVVYAPPQLVDQVQRHENEIAVLKAKVARLEGKAAPVVLGPTPVVVTVRPQCGCDAVPCPTPGFCGGGGCRCAGTATADLRTVGSSGTPAEKAAAANAIVPGATTVNADGSIPIPGGPLVRLPDGSVPAQLSGCRTVQTGPATCYRLIPGTLDIDWSVPPTVSAGAPGQVCGPGGCRPVAAPAADEGPRNFRVGDGPWVTEAEVRRQLGAAPAAPACRTYTDPRTGRTYTVCPGR